MAYDSRSDRWTYPCDLCGSIDAEEISLPVIGDAYRCGECGLITIPPGTASDDDAEPAHDHRRHNGSPGGRSVNSPRSLKSLRRSLRQAAREGAESVLLVGAASLALVPVARDQGLRMMAVIDADSTSRDIPDVITHQCRLGAAPFLPDQFDVIVCAGGLETMEIPSAFFERARTWLVSGGALLIGTSNWRSLPARLWRRNWMRRNGHDIFYLLTPDTVRGYADRYGFEVRELQTRTSTGMVANIASPGRRPSRLVRLSLAPIALASGILRMGDEMSITLLKRGAATRPMRQKVSAEQTDESPGLAPALYSGVNRSVEIERHLGAESGR